MAAENNEVDAKRAAKGFGVLEKVNYLSDVLGKQSEIRNMLDVRSNIVIGFNSALLVFMVANFGREIISSPFLLVAFGVIALSLFCGILALKPPHFDTKQGQSESVFYHNHIDKESLETYKKKLLDDLTDENKMYESYATEIYNITHFSNVPRKFYLYLSIRVLIYGLMLSFAIYLLLISANLI